MPQGIEAPAGRAALGLLDLSTLVGVGNLARRPRAVRAAVAAIVDAIVQGIYGAFSLAVAQTFYLGVFGALVALIAALAIKELPLRATNSAPVSAAAPAGRPAPSIE